MRVDRFHVSAAIGGRLFVSNFRIRFSRSNYIELHLRIICLHFRIINLSVNTGRCFYRASFASIYQTHRRFSGEASNVRDRRYSYNRVCELAIGRIGRNSYDSLHRQINSHAWNWLMYVNQLSRESSRIHTDSLTREYTESINVEVTIQLNV